GLDERCPTPIGPLQVLGAMAQEGGGRSAPGISLPQEDCRRRPDKAARSGDSLRPGLSLRLLRRREAERTGAIEKPAITVHRGGGGERVWGPEGSRRDDKPAWPLPLPPVRDGRTAQAPGRAEGLASAGPFPLTGDGYGHETAGRDERFAAAEPPQHRGDTC